MHAVTILLVDDSDPFRAALAALLACDSALMVVGQAATAAEGLALAAALQPRLALVDLALPGPSGLELTRWLKARSPAPLVIVLSLHTLSAYRHAAVEAGADAFLSKDDVSLALLALIDRLIGPREGARVVAGSGDGAIG